MRKLKRSRRGIGLIDAILTLFLLGVAGVVLTATFPTCFKAGKQAQQYKIATVIAQKEMERLRAMNYQSLQYTQLHLAEAVDTGSQSSPYSFTTADQYNKVSDKLPGGTGTLYISDTSSNTKEAKVVVSWQGVGNANRSITLVTLFTDKRTK